MLLLSPLGQPYKWLDNCGYYCNWGIFFFMLWLHSNLGDNSFRLHPFPLMRRSIIWLPDISATLIVPMGEEIDIGKTQSKDKRSISWRKSFQISLAILSEKTLDCPFEVFFFSRVVCFADNCQWSLVPN